MDRSHLSLGYAQLPPFLALPREIRDLIYSYVVFYGKIAIEPAIVHIDSSYDPGDEDSEPGDEDSDMELYPLRYPCKSRKTWASPSSDVIDGRTGTTQFTYQHARYQDSTNIHDRRILRDSQIYTSWLDLQVTSVCRQMYAEACELFYSMNTFQFLEDFRIPTALHFLEDRPAKALSKIKSLHLALTEDDCSLDEETTGDQYIHDQNTSEGNFYLRSAYDFYPRLCSLMASPNMQLRHLQLLIETQNPVGSSLDPTLATSLRLNTLATSVRLEEQENIGPSSWVSPLLAIRDLDVITLQWVFFRLLVRKVATVANLMRAKMLKVRREETRAAASLDGNFVDMKIRIMTHYYMDEDWALCVEMESGNVSWQSWYVRPDENGRIQGFCFERQAATELLSELVHVYGDLDQGAACFCTLEGK
ncbi:hypothetical protein BDV95DRAFT_578231 [Massariosphaeria phaeospora]|uniref:DUF7730 domain-containing protein n=1 Tax=Massariosphaeria phaeospora TaxID=100035 RepID=A0A7C8I2E0_9PLEO|nr:hypothetical protein BDV95DRAFT_578231 [Massariosphaeria phaeospora]